MKKNCMIFVLLIVCALQLYGSQHKSAQEIASSAAMQGFAQASAALKARADGIHIEGGYITISHPANMTYLAKAPTPTKSDRFHNLQKQYNAQLALEELALMKEFFALANIRAAEWQKRYSESSDSYCVEEHKRFAEVMSRFDQPLDEKLRQRIEKLLADQSINPLSLTIIRDDTSASVCWMMRNLLMVNQTFLLEVYPMEFEAIILHEIMHKLYNDPYISFCIEHCLIEKKVAQNKVAHFLKKWRLFCERRADIMAALKSIDHAKASIQFFSQLKQCYKSEFHPPHKERAAYLTQVLKEMEVVVPQTAAA